MCIKKLVVINRESSTEAKLSYCKLYSSKFHIKNDECFIVVPLNIIRACSAQNVRTRHRHKVRGRNQHHLCRLGEYER